ncbi:hypothetical protein TMatcc_009696 [Talaromyces marneffei ATCC 18224]|uniref:Oxidoreductase acuF-like C2H2 type zinc-finger domain-containing protein n=1 Tax=Talaromyces marneffei (strain ATCC 18224 / CBS 334.59 / QM 7333) TaxID=441960 RepID=B6QSZ8_TALMQ|nr:uncharacterized protein EYB26_008937 [Talaromyces marneffei]EEA19561.1 conserved hypothetical protein [Talaromyces marneffei ATCC 18224]KAE8547875.1 hypothetical protein EYB25_009668 [Talaromyces marneffei]QGA21227.1 hypothetical protein EYB26_008937 [Talaromyces marneffei]
MKDTISQLLNQCLREFAAITDSESVVRYETEVSHRRWLDELGRLRVWSGNIGAHQTGQSSLDYRLRDASHLREETTRLLSRLLHIFQDVAEVINENDDEEALEIEIEDDDETKDMTEVQQLYQSIADTINSLFQISMAIRRPADHDRLLNIRVKDDSFFEPWARQHVSQKYPDAGDALISRLGRAMARQKAILKYRERHRAKLGKGLFGDVETTSTRLSETVATEIAPDNDQLHFLDTASNSGLSHTSYATSLMESKLAASIPKPPKASKDRSPFECPYCFHIIMIKHKRDWARHVFRDVMPYVCVSMSCTTPSRLYESRHQWFFHMREAHRQGQNGLACPLCHAEIQALSSFEKHVGRHLEELALFFLPPTDVDDEEEEGASDAAPSVPSVNRSGSDSGPTQELQIPIGSESTEGQSNIITYEVQSRLNAIDATGMGEEDLSASSRGSDSDDRARSRSGTLTSSRPEDDGGIVTMMSGVAINVTHDSVSERPIHVGDDGVAQLEIGGGRPKQYRMGSHKYTILESADTLPQLEIGGGRPRQYITENHRYASRNSASRRAISADGRFSPYTLETAVDRELTGASETREYQGQGGTSKRQQERRNKFESESGMMEEGVSALEDVLELRVSGGQEWQHIGAKQPLNAEAVTKESEWPKPLDPVRHQSSQNRPQVVVVSQPSRGRGSLERHSDMTSNTPEEKYLGDREYAQTARRRRIVYHTPQNYVHDADKGGADCGP